LEFVATNIVNFISLAAFKRCLKKVDFSSYMHVKFLVSVSVDFVDFVRTVHFIVTFFLFFKGQLLMFIFGALLFGSFVVSHIAWIVSHL